MLLAVACVNESRPADDDDESSGAGAGSSAPSCAFESVIDEMTCGGSNDGMVCPSTTYCAACDREVAVTCTCRDSGGAFGHQFECGPCESACGSGGGSGDGGGGGGGALSYDTRCGAACANQENAPDCEPTTDCLGQCQSIIDATPAHCEGDLAAMLTCEASTTEWLCNEGEVLLFGGCFNELEALSNCVSG